MIVERLSKQDGRCNTHGCAMWFQRTPAHSALRFSRSGSSCKGYPLDPGQCGAFASYCPRHTPRPPPPPPREGDTMPFETQGPEPLDAVINVRLTAAEKARLKEDADLAGLSMSELVRRRYFGRPIIANADAVMLKELRRIGGLLKHIHNESGGVYSKDTAGALVALKAYIERLSRDR
jgi:hypothetical protein